MTDVHESILLTAALKIQFQGGCEEVVSEADAG